MHHVLAAKGRANLRRRQHADKRQVARRAPAACGARPLPRRPPTSSTAAFPAAPHRDTFSKPADRQAGPAGEPDRIDAALRQQRLDAIGKRRSAPPPAGAPRAQTAASPPPVPLYPGAASTTNPVRAAAPRHRARARRSGPTTKRSRRARSQISPVTMQRRWAPPSPASAVHARRRGADAERPSRLLLLRRHAGVSSSNQWARACMISALAVSRSRVTPPLSEAASSLEQLVAGKVGEIVEGLDPLLAERHQHARGQVRRARRDRPRRRARCRRSSYSRSRRSSAVRARSCSSAAISASKPSMSARSSSAT